MSLLEFEVVYFISKKAFNKHCRARPCKLPRPYDPDFGISMSHLLGMCHKEVWVLTNFFMAHTEQL